MGAALPKPSFDAVDESRIDAMLRGMSLDEKLGQMWQVDWRTMRPRPGCASVPWLGRLMELVVNLLPGCSSDRPLRDEDVEDVLIVIEAASKMRGQETITLVLGMTVQAIPTKAVISIKIDTRQGNSSQAT